MAIEIPRIAYLPLRALGLCEKPARRYKFYAPARNRIEYQHRVIDQAVEVTPLENQFNALAKKWKDETSGYSSVASMVMHPAYLEIISHGEKMIPYILKDLQQKPSHWFIALKTLAKNYSPVKPEDAGNIKKMTEAWIAWGKENGKLR